MGFVAQKSKYSGRSGSSRSTHRGPKTIEPTGMYDSVDVASLSSKYRSMFEATSGALSLVRETERAVLLSDGSSTSWVPKSSIDPSRSIDRDAVVEDVRELIGRLKIPMLHADDGEYDDVLRLPLMAHQKDVIKTLEGRPRVAMFADMGTGKTPMSLARMVLFDDGLPNLIICGKSLMAQWRSEIDKFCPWMQDRIFIINYDMIFRKSAEKFLSQFRPGEFNLTLEEVGCLGNEDAKRTRKCMELASQCRNLQMLTGSFFGGRFEKFYPCAVMQGYEGSRMDYEDRFCIKVKQQKRVGYGRYMRVVDDWRIVDYKNIPELIMETAERGAVFLRTEDCVDLPEENRFVVTLGSTDEARSASDRIMADSRSGVAPSQGDLVAVKRENDLAHNQEKMDYVREAVSSSDDRWCVFYQYNGERDALRSMLSSLGRPVSEVSGSVKDLSAYEKYDNSVTIIQIVAGATGINLQKCNRSIFTMPFNADQQLQAERRTRRIGQTRPCFYYILSTDSRYDESRLRDIESKREAVNSIG